MASNAKGDASAATWTVVSRAAAQGAQFVVFLVAARFLTPEQFGVYVLLAAINILMLKLAEAGWREFTTSWRGEIEVDAHAFTLASLGGVALAALGAVSAWVFLHVPDLADYAMLQLLLSVSVLPRGTFAIWSGYLIRGQRAQLLAKAVLISQVVSAAVSIVGLMEGYGLVALGAGKVAFQFGGVLVLAVAGGWYPGFRLTSSGGSTIASFTKSLLGAQLIGYLQANVATLLLSLFLGPVAVGLYRAAVRVAGSLYDVLAEPLRIVCWMMLRRSVEEGDKGPGEPGRAEDAPVDLGALSLSAERFITVSVAACAPLFIGLALTSRTAVTVMLGEQWADAAPIVAILAIARLALTPVLLTSPLLSLSQHVDRIAVLQLWSGAATLIAFPIFSPFGIVPTAIGELVVAVFSAWLSIRAHARYGSVRWGRALVRSAPSTIASVAMALALLGMRLLAGDVTDDLRWQLVAEVALGLLVFLPLFTLMGGWRQLSRAYAG